MSARTKILPVVIVVLNILIVSYIFSHLPKPKQTLETHIPQKAQELTTECAESPDWLTCYRASFSRLTKQSSVDDAMNVLLATQNIDPKVRDCHVITHSIAIAEVEKNPRAWQDLLASIDVGLCGAGFIHGVIEGLSRSDPEFKLDANTIPQFCNSIRKTVLGSEEIGSIGCIHIMGHLLLVEEETDVASAIKVCDTLTPQAQYECYQGAFMENVTRNNLVIHGLAKPFPMDETGATLAEDICRQYTDLAAQACWRELAHIYTNLMRDPEQIQRRCSRAPTELAQEECYIHSMQVVTHDTSSAKYETMVKICAPFTSSSQKFTWCVRELNNSLLNNPQYTEEVIQFCNAIGAEYQRYCYSTIGVILSEFVTPQDREKLCRSAPVQFKKHCSKT